MSNTRLTYDHFQSYTTLGFARSLLGKSLVRRINQETLSGIIVETEAYLSKNDKASHSHRGQTVRNRSMFGPAGTAYVYTIHAKYCFNIVTGKEGSGSAVLVRAIEPVSGVDQMQSMRSAAESNLTNGPGKLCQAMGIDLSLDGVDLATDNRIWIEEPNESLFQKLMIRSSPRIGISVEVDRPFRFFVDRNRFVSGPKRFHSNKADQSLLTLDG